jgi:hypothetical protein
VGSKRKGDFDDEESPPQKRWVFNTSIQS